MPKVLMIKRQSKSNERLTAALSDEQRSAELNSNCSDGNNSRVVSTRPDMVPGETSCIKSVRSHRVQTDVRPFLLQPTLRITDGTTSNSPAKSVLRNIENIYRNCDLYSVNKGNHISSVPECVSFGDMRTVEDRMREEVGVNKTDSSWNNNKQSSLSVYMDPGQLDGLPLRADHGDIHGQLTDKSTNVNHGQFALGLSTGTDHLVNKSDLLGRTPSQTTYSLPISPRKLLTDMYTRSEHVGKCPVSSKKSLSRLGSVLSPRRNKENITAYSHKSPKRISPSKKNINSVSRNIEVCGNDISEPIRIKKVLFPVMSEFSDEKSANVVSDGDFLFGNPRIQTTSVEPTNDKCVSENSELVTRVGQRSRSSDQQMTFSRSNSMSTSLERSIGQQFKNLVAHDVHTVSVKDAAYLEETQVKELTMNNTQNDHRSSSYDKFKIKYENDKTHYYSFETGSSLYRSNLPPDLSVSNSCEYVVSKDEQSGSSHLDIPPPTVLVDVVGSDDDCPSAEIDYLKMDRRGDEDSGVVLDLSRSREVHNSPRPEQCWAKPLLASTPLWRPWSHSADSPANRVHCIYEQQYSMSSLETSPFGQHGHPTTYQPTSTDLPLDLRITPQYQGHTFASKYANAPSPLENSFACQASYQNYPKEPSPPASKLFQCQVPQVTTTSSATREIKRPSSDTQATAPPVKQSCIHTPTHESTTRAPLAERSLTFDEQTVNIPGVQLGVPPADALPARVSLKGKRKVSKEDHVRCKKSKVSDSAKKRDRPPPYGDHELHEFSVNFDETSLKSKFCDENGIYQVPKVPDSREEQAQLRTELLELFRHSNLPSIPSALQYNVHALCFYPKMKHLFSLHLDGVNLEVLNFGAYGQAFSNLRLAALADDDLNTILDRMSYVGGDGLMHCLVRRVIDNGAVCDHVATELGKMRRHSKNHFPEKKWVCCFCRAQMPDMTDMERHTSTHTGLKPFRCIECNKFFSQKVTLAHHLKSVHNRELEKMDPKKTFTCRQDGCLFLEEEREACLLHLEQHHHSEDFKNRKKRGQWPFDLI